MKRIIMNILFLLCFSSVFASSAMYQVHHDCSFQEGTNLVSDMEWNGPKEKLVCHYSSLFLDFTNYEDVLNLPNLEIVVDSPVLFSDGEEIEIWYRDVTAQGWSNGMRKLVQGAPNYIASMGNLNGKQIEVRFFLVTKKTSDQYDKNTIFNISGELMITLSAKLKGGIETILPVDNSDDFTLLQGGNASIDGPAVDKVPSCFLTVTERNYYQLSQSRAEALADILIQGIHISEPSNVILTITAQSGDFHLEKDNERIPYILYLGTNRVNADETIVVALNGSKNYTRPQESFELKAKIDPSINITSYSAGFYSDTIQIGVTLEE